MNMTIKWESLLGFLKVGSIHSYQLFYPITCPCHAQLVALVYLKNCQNLLFYCSFFPKISQNCQGPLQNGSVALIWYFSKLLKGGGWTSNQKFLQLKKVTKFQEGKNQGERKKLELEKPSSNEQIYSRDQGLVQAPRPNAGRAEILLENQ